VLVITLALGMAVFLDSFRGALLAFGR